MYISLKIILIFLVFFLLLLVIIMIIGKKIGEAGINRIWEKRLPEIRKESLNRSRGVVRGQVMEQWAPFFPDFPFKPQDCHFLGKPIDFLVFQDLDEYQGQSASNPSVVFVEVKTGKSRLSPREKRVKEAIENKNVFWYEYHFPG